MTTSVDVDPAVGTSYGQAMNMLTSRGAVMPMLLTVALLPVLLLASAAPAQTVKVTLRVTAPPTTPPDAKLYIAVMFLAFQACMNPSRTSSGV